MNKKECIEWIEKMEKQFVKEMWGSSSIWHFIEWLKEKVAER